MTVRYLAAVYVHPPRDLALFLIAPHVFLDVDVVRVGEEAGFEIDGGRWVRTRDMDVASRVRIGAER